MLKSCMDTTHIIRPYLEQFATQYSTVRPMIGTSEINMRCPVCGDSEKNPRMMRFWFKLMPSKDGGQFYTARCWNGDCDPTLNEGTSATHFFKKFYPEISKELTREKILHHRRDDKFGGSDSDDDWGGNTKSSEVSSDAPGRKYKLFARKDGQKPEEIKEEPKKTIKDFAIGFTLLKDIVQKKVSGYKYDVGVEAIKYCHSRGIPPEVFLKFFICVAPQSKFHQRIILPFYKSDGSYDYFIARSFSETKTSSAWLKYLYPKLDRPLYGLDFVKNGVPVVLTEGQLDSEFVENGVGIGGSTLSQEFQNTLIQFDKLWMLDNDKTGRKKSIQLMEKSEKVFLWWKFLKDKGLKNKRHLIKDVNDLAIALGMKKIPQEVLAPYFSSSPNMKTYLKEI